MKTNSGLRAEETVSDADQYLMLICAFVGLLRTFGLLEVPTMQIKKVTHINLNGKGKKHR